MRLRSERLLITPFTPQDLDLVKLLVQDPDVVKHTGFRTVTADEDVPAILDKWVTTASAARGMWKVVAHSTGEFVGAAMLKDTTLPYPELGYMLVKSQWGKGYATEMAQAVLDYGIHELSLKAVMAGTDSDNLPSIKVLTKIGMTAVTDPDVVPDLDPALVPDVPGGGYYIKRAP